MSLVTTAIIPPEVAETPQNWTALANGIQHCVQHSLHTAVVNDTELTILVDMRDILRKIH